MLALEFARPCSELTNPPVPPNIAYFLDHGLRDTGRWFVPLILRLSPDVTADDVRSVLTAVTNHHDALRLQIVERAGAWEQRIAPPQEFSRLLIRSLPPGLAADSPAERDAVMAILGQLVDGDEPSDPPVAAAYVAAGPGDRCYLAVAVHHVAADDTSRQILMADLVVAFGQRMAGKDIELQPASMTWREWSQRCTSLATHPAVLDTRDYWLDNCAHAPLGVADHHVTERPHADDLTRLSVPLPELLTAELDGARGIMGMATEEILLAALGRTIARTVGEGVVGVDLPGRGRSVLEPDADLHRTLGWFTTFYPVALSCVTDRNASATEMLTAVHRTLAAVPHHGIGHGLLRYFYAPTTLQLAARQSSEILFSYMGTLRQPPSDRAPVQFDIDPAMPVRKTPPGLGHALELRAYRTGGVVQMDWWYDTRRLDRHTVEEFTEQFPLALIELTSEATPPTDEATETAIATSTSERHIA